MEETKNSQGIPEIQILVADESHERYVDTILKTIEEAAKVRGTGIAKKIKDMTFSLARTRWPHAKIFSLTSGKAVMKMNTQLGYLPVTFDDLTDDEAFWKGCEGCVNINVLRERNRKFCICTAMLFDPEEHLPAKIPQEVINRINRLDGKITNSQEFRD